MLEKIGLIFKSLSISHEITTAPRIAKSLDTIKINNQDGIIHIKPNKSIRFKMVSLTESNRIHQYERKKYKSKLGIDLSA